MINFYALQTLLPKLCQTILPSPSQKPPRMYLLVSPPSLRKFPNLLCQLLLAIRASKLPFISKRIRVKLLYRLLYFCGSVLLYPHLSFGQAGFPARGFSPILDSSQAQEKLDSFKHLIFPAHKEQTYHQGYLYRFEFIHYPRSGQPTIDHGFLSGPYPDSPVLRIDIFSRGQNAQRKSSFLLIRDQNNSRAWKFDAGNSLVKSLSPDDWLLPWIEGINHAPFDLLMPFVNWSFEYEKSGKVCGRPAHLFIFNLGENSKFTSSFVRSVRLAIDDNYFAPLRIEIRDGSILPRRIISLQSYKKVHDRWIVKAIDVKDRDSGSRTRFEFKAAAHQLDLPEAVFQHDGLAQPINFPSIPFEFF